MGRELLFSLTKKDFEVQWFSGTGAGGQHRNKHQNCCRLYHPASGVRTTGQSNRDRIANQREAFTNMVNHPKFKLWMNQKVMECLDEETIEEKVDKQMRPEYILTECKNKVGRWVPACEICGKAAVWDCETSSGRLSHRCEEHSNDIALTGNRRKTDA